jgi:chromosome segregation ATPase
MDPVKPVTVSSVPDALKNNPVANKLSELVNRLNTAVAANTQLQGRVSKLESQGSEKDQQIQALATEKLQLENTSKSQTNELAEAQRQVADLQRQLREVTEKFDKLNAEVTALNSYAGEIQ